MWYLLYVCEQIFFVHELCFVNSTNTIVFSVLPLNYSSELKIMTTTVVCPITVKNDPKYPGGQISLVVSDEDADWISKLTLQLGRHGHPSVRSGKQIDDTTSLARLVMKHHGIAVEDNQWVCRVDTTKPFDVSHENICVPVPLIQRHIDCTMKGARTISLKDYLSVCSINRPSHPEAEPTFVNVIDMDTAKQNLLICDAEDAEWLEGMPVRFNQKGFPMIQADWGKWTSLMFEQARRAGADKEGDPIVFHLKPKEPRDVRKYYIAIVTKDRMTALA